MNFQLWTRNHLHCQESERTGTPCSPTASPFLMLVLVLFSPLIAFAQSAGRQPQKSTESTRHKGVVAERPCGVNKTPQLQRTVTVSLPSGTVVLDETPPPPPRTVPKTVPANAPAGEEVGVEDVVRISSNLVTVPASVIDSEGRAVTDLKLEEFELRVDGQPRPISEINFSDTPVRLVMLFDNSMSLSEGREFEKEAAIRFFRKVVRPVDHAAVYSIYTYPILAQPFTSDVEALVRTIEGFPKPVDGTTSLFDTIAEAAAYLRPYTERKVIIIISDGDDTTSELDFETALKRVQAADCQIYAIQTGGYQESAGLYNAVARKQLRSFSEQTGGALYVPRETSDLDFDFTQVAKDLAQQYVLNYYSAADEGRDGRFRTISVRVATRPNMRVRSRRGYYPRRPNENFSFHPKIPVNRASVESANRPEPVSQAVPSQAKAPAEALSATPNENSNAAPVRVSRTGPTDTDALVAESSGTDSSGYTKPKPSVKEAATSETPGRASGAGSTKPAPKVPPSESTQPVPKRPVSGGVLNGKAVSLPKPFYPPSARSAGVSGTVSVEVTIDEEGKVIAARAVSGPAMLYTEAVRAARLARFSPTELSGQPVKVTGVINYAFLQR